MKETDSKPTVATDDEPEDGTMELIAFWIVYTAAAVSLIFWMLA